MMKYKNVEQKSELKHKQKWEKFRSRESNQNKSCNVTSLLFEDTKMLSQNVNQNSLKDTPILIKRSYADVLVNGNEVVNKGNIFSTFGGGTEQEW